MAQHNDLGKEGELRAQQFLRDHGYIIRDCNWRFGHAELDIVAEKNGLLIVVEVKSRSTEHFEHPKDAVTPTKIRHIVTAAHEYILQHNIDADVRFDVVSVIPDHGNYRIEHIEDAFLAPIN
ncbi:MAG: YraN family protein [Paludibacteraceae bacterium]